MPLFSLVFGAGYAVAVIGNWPLFRYYPLVKRFSLTDLADKSLGPAMTWYGWMAAGALPALVIAMLGSVAIPQRWLDRLWILYWVLPVVMLASGYYRERSWLQH